MNGFDDEIWRGLLNRVVEKVKRYGGDTVYYSHDLDQYLDADNPVADPKTTIREEIRQLCTWVRGAEIKYFVRVDLHSGLTNYIGIGRGDSVKHSAGLS